MHSHHVIGVENERVEMQVGTVLVDDAAVTLVEADMDAVDEHVAGVTNGRNQNSHELMIVESHTHCAYHTLYHATDVDVEIEIDAVDGEKAEIEMVDMDKKDEQHNQNHLESYCHTYLIQIHVHHIHQHCPYSVVIAYY